MFENLNLKNAKEMSQQTNNSIIENKKNNLQRVIQDIEETSQKGDYKLRTTIEFEEIVDYLVQKEYKLKKHGYAEYTISWDI